MRRERYAAGETVFQEGEESLSVCRLVSGTLEVSKDSGGRPVVLGRIRAGEYAGEMGVLEGRPRSATVIAVTDATVDVFDRDEFLADISRDSGMAFDLLVRLSARLSGVDRAFAAAAGSAGLAAQDPAGTAASGPTLRLAAASSRLDGVLRREGVVIGRLPFTVGRAVSPGEARPSVEVDLTLTDQRPYRLSRAHFWIADDHGGLNVRDLGSMLGTEVNGEAIGHDFKTDEAPLRPGENQITAGGAGSPFAFTLFVGS